MSDFASESTVTLNFLNAYVNRFQLYILAAGELSSLRLSRLSGVAGRF